MSLPTIPQRRMIQNTDIKPDPDFGGLKIVRYQTDGDAQKAYINNEYEFQHEAAKRHIINGVTLSLKGSPGRYRITATIHPTLRQFTDIVRYDPSAPPLENWEAVGMKEAHEQTQSDFKGTKKENLGHFKQYLIESIRGDRTAYLPTVSGWQSSEVFGDTIFVAVDESNPMALYGVLYLPKKPVMQSDGQTQTAALFQAAATGLAEKAEALDKFGTTLEIELNVNPVAAGQSFADRNGRGSKKNKNLVARMDSSSALSQLRTKTIAGTIFEHRFADGRTVGATETATKNIVDLSTLDQMLLNVISRGTKKDEQIKIYHVEHFLPYCKEFVKLLEDKFGDKWLDDTPKDSEPYRRLYIHGWAFALKALAIVFHDSRRDELGPLANAINTIGSADSHQTAEEAEQAFLKAVEDANPQDRKLTPAEFEERIDKIDWLRYRKHWIDLTGRKVASDGKPKTRVIKVGTDSDGKVITKTVADGKAENTAAAINFAVNKIEGATWTDLTSDVDAKP
ncbi:hypothetical protein ACSW29_27720 [Rhodococcus sp. GB-02]